MRTAPAAVEIERLRAADVMTAAEVLSASHHDYPAFTHLFPHPRRRHRALRSFFRASVRDAERIGASHVAKGPGGDPLGVGIWLPPGAFPWSFLRKLRATPSFAAVALAAPRSSAAFVRTGANTERAHPRDRHWYLETLGVRPEIQGKGVGSRLLAAGLARADAEHCPCFLETAREENVGFYERFGFRVTEPELELVPGGPTHWAMLRPGRLAAI